MSTRATDAWPAARYAALAHALPAALLATALAGCGARGGPAPAQPTPIPTAPDAGPQADAASASSGAGPRTAHGDAAADRSGAAPGALAPLDLLAPAGAGTTAPASGRSPLQSHAPTRSAARAAAPGRTPMPRSPSTGAEGARQDRRPERSPNRLVDAASPYLLQHAYNPVDWRPWGEEAFAEARAEDKPIFLSIGYSSCHWCHVMEDESFADEELAALMNEAFVNVKVDREERPDIDEVYMTACQLMSGHCGWPLNLLLTPEGQPFFAGTYLPREERFGRPGMMQLVPRVAGMWREDRARLLEQAGRVASAMAEASGGAPGDDLDAALVARARDELAQRYDAEHGGFGEAPKFPSPHQLVLLLRHADRAEDPEAREMALHTLRAMRRGGIFDQVGFGFHRYATDRAWLLPHFEKMLYDQALLLLAYTEAYDATGEEDLAEVAREIREYVLREMSDPSGGFHSAEDADSEGEEGLFYTWTQTQLRRTLGDEDARLAMAAWRATTGGDYLDEASRRPTGRNILHLGLGETPADDPANAARLERIRRKLYVAREERIRPLKDDKVLTDWNGLMIAALARAAQVLGDEPSLAAARRAADFALTTMRRADGRLLHRWRGGEAAVDGTLDDYAYLVWGLLELYRADGDLRWLEAALELDQAMRDHFWDPEEGGLFLTPDDGEVLLTRPKSAYDGARPSGNSVAMGNLVRLARLTGRAELEARAAEIGRAFSASVPEGPSAFAQLLQALDLASSPSREVVLVGAADAAGMAAMEAALRASYRPRLTLLRKRTSEPDDPLVRLAPFTETMVAQDGRATAYVCQDFVCDRPTTDPQVLREALR